ncbi:hypothetical protein Hanom_Chr09g00859411 [Helianthus anomalus]
MEPIKSNYFLNQYQSSDYAEMKSQPFKLPKITALMAVPGGYLRFSAHDLHNFGGWFVPPFSTHDLHNFGGSIQIFPKNRSLCSLEKFLAV